MVCSGLATPFVCTRTAVPNARSGVCTRTANIANDGSGVYNDSLIQTAFRKLKNKYYLTTKRQSLSCSLPSLKQAFVSIFWSEWNEKMKNHL